MIFFGNFTFFMQLTVSPTSVNAIVIKSLKQQRNALIELNTCIIISTVLHVSALIAPSSERSLL